jgi:hemoglobin
MSVEASRRKGLGLNLVLTIPQCGTKVSSIGDTTLQAIPETAERRAALTREIVDRTGLDEASIERFLRAFYGAAREDPLLGPAFAGVADWEGHIGTLSRFWGSVALMTGGYHGQPMRAHAHLALTPAHFARWLALFEATARGYFTAEGVEHVLERARRIARSLELGLIPLELPVKRREAPPGLQQ